MFITNVEKFLLEKGVKNPEIKSIEKNFLKYNKTLDDCIGFYSENVIYIVPTQKDNYIKIKFKER